MPVGRLSTRHGRGTSTSQVFRRLHVCRPAYTVTDWRQEFPCSRTAAMKQPTEERHCLQFKHYCRLFKAFLFVWAAAHCDFYLSAPDKSTLTHSLTQSVILFRLDYCNVIYRDQTDRTTEFHADETSILQSLRLVHRHVQRQYYIASILPCQRVIFNTIVLRRNASIGCRLSP